MLSVCRSVCGHCYATHTLAQAHATTRHLHLHSCMRRVCMCMCVYMCASCSLHFYTCSRFSYFHAARTFYPTPLAFIFALFFAHFYLRRLLAIWNSFFSSFSFVASRNPARTISKVPLRSNVLDKLNGKERKVKSAQQQQQQQHEQQESGRVAAAAAPIYASFIAPYASQVSVCVTLSCSRSPSSL